MEGEKREESKKKGEMKAGLTHRDLMVAWLRNVTLHELTFIFSHLEDFLSYLKQHTR